MNNRSSRWMAAALLLVLSALTSVHAASCDGHLLDVEADFLMGGSANLCQEYAGDVVLVVNTASHCGYTGQLGELQALHARYRAQGFTVLGFPSGDFANQEFEDAEKIAEFCRVNFGVEFPMFARTRVTGDEAHAVFRALAAAGAPPPAWNFHKYVIGRDGQLVGSFTSREAPTSDAVLETIRQAMDRQQGVP